MKVLFLIDSEAASNGGAEKICGLSAALLQNGVKVIAYSNDATAKSGKLGGVFPCYFGPLPKPRILQFARAVFPVRQLCQAHGIDLVHCHGFSQAGNTGWLLKHAIGLPYLITTEIGTQPQGWVERRRCRAILRDAGAVIQATQGQAGPDIRHKTFVIPCGVDLAWWRKPVTPQSGDYVLASGKLDRGLDIVLDAWRILAKRGIPWSLVLTGMESAAASIQTRAQALGLRICRRLEDLEHSGPSSICCCAGIEGERKRAVVAGSKLLIVPSPEARKGQEVLLEAMAAGKALVASDTPITRELWQDQEHGLLVSAQDPQHWARAIQSLHDDWETRLTYETINRRSSMAFSWDNLAGRYVRMYQQVLGRLALSRAA